MNRWHWRIAIGAATILCGIGIYWGAETCEAAAEECYANAVAPWRPGPKQTASEYEAIQTCHETQCYLCRVIAPANLPNVGLLIAGILGICIALRTLKAIERQGDSLERQTKAVRRQAVSMRRQTTIFRESVRVAKESSEDERISLIRLNRAYLTVTDWQSIITPPDHVCAQLKVYNPSGTAARIETIESTFREVTTTANVGRMLTPREGYWHSIPPEIIESESVETFLIMGLITYIDIFGKTRHRKFARYCQYTPPVRPDQLPSVQFLEAEGAAWNDEEEWNKEDEQPNQP